MDGLRLINFFVTSGKFQRGLLYALCCFFTLPNWAWPSALTASPLAQNILTSKQIEALSKVTCPEFPKMVSRYQQRFAQPIRIWSQAYLTKVNYSTVFYPFSGPDVVTILSMFPRADYLVLVADQLPEYQVIQSPLEAAGTTSEFECGMLEQFSQRGYYFTNDLIGKNGPKPRFIQLLIYNIAFSGDLFNQFPALKFLIPHGGGAVPYHWGRFRGLAQELKKPLLAEHLLKNIFFDTCVYHQPGINLLTEVMPVKNILFASEMIGAVRGIDPQTGFYFDDTKRYIESQNQLSSADRQKIYEGNARHVFPLLDQLLKTQCK